MDLSVFQGHKCEMNEKTLPKLELCSPSLLPASTAIALHTHTNLTDSFLSEDHPYLICLTLSLHSQKNKE